MDSRGRPAIGVVTASIDPNPCEWPIGGTTSIRLVDGKATFADLTLGQVTRGLTLAIRSGTLEAVADPIDVVEPAPQERVLIHENTLCSKPNPQKDAESLEYIPEDGLFWMADDDGSGIFSVDGATGAFRSSLTSAEFIAAFPTAGICDDGDNDPTTSCSYTEEFELLAYDREEGALYVLNTVNNASQLPVKDRPALFKLLRGGCSGCWTFDSWRALPTDAHYGALATIDGYLYVGIGRRVYGYDYATNRVLATDEQGDSLPPVFTASSSIQLLHYDGNHVWMVVGSSRVLEIDWETRSEVGSYEIEPLGVSVVKGVEVVGGRIYVLDGDPPNPIYIFRPSAGL